MATLEFEIPTSSWSHNEREILMAMMYQIGFDGFNTIEESNWISLSFVK